MASNLDRDDDYDDRPVTTGASKRTTAGILAILLGGIGVHKFYLGQTTAGIIMLVLACTGIPALIGLVEGIIYLTKSDAEFVQTYQVGKKAWF